MAESDSDEEFIMTMITAGYICLEEKKNKRSMWVKPWLRKRAKYGVRVTLLRELREEYVLHDDYRRYLRIDPPTFDLLLNMVREKVEKKDTNYRFSIPAEERLALTLRFLATGSS